MNTPRPDRIPCEVLGCRRTAPKVKYGEGTRIICGKCWRTGDREDRRAYCVAERQIRRLSALQRLLRLTDAENDDLAAAFDQKHEAFLRVQDRADQIRAGLA